MTRKGQPIGGLEIVRIIQEHIELELSDDGSSQSIGQIVDAEIARRLHEGQELQNINVHLDPRDYASSRALRDLYGEK